MAFTDRQNLVFSKLAYIDNLDARIGKYTERGLTPPPIGSLLTKKEIDNLVNNYHATREELNTWRIVEVQENPKTEFSACIIDCGNGDAAVGFRGSLSLDAEHWEKTWVDADFKLLTRTQTNQHKDCINFLKNNSALLNKYDNLSFTGHSLGGNLSVYSTIMAKDCGVDINKVKCTSLDGPGFNKEFIDKYGDKIGAVSDRITQYRWSVVGSCLQDLPGVDPKHVVYKDYKDYTGETKCSEDAYKSIVKHDLNSVVFEGDTLKTTDKPRADEIKTKEISQFLDVTLQNKTAGFFTKLYLLSPAGGLIYSHLNNIDPALAEKFKQALNDTFSKMYNLVVDSVLTVIGKAGTALSFLQSGWNYVCGFFNGENARRKAEANALKKARKSAKANPAIHIDLIEFKNLASDCSTIAKNLGKISTKLKQTYKLPSVFNDNKPKVPIISDMLGLVNKAHNKCNELINKKGQAAKKCDDCKDKLKAISSFLSDSAFDFTQVDLLAKTEMESWYNSYKGAD